MRLRLGLLICLVWLGTAGTASAQNAWQVGVKGGLNGAKVIADPDEASSDWRMGAVAGGFVRGRLTNLLGVQVEALYTMNGGSDEEFVVFETVEQTLKLDYLQIPVLLHVKGGQRGVASLLAYIGPTFGFLLKADQDAFGETVSRESEFKSTDVGLAMGAGAEVAGVSIEVRYTHGLSNILTSEGKESIGLNSAKNRTLALIAGFTFLGR